MPPHENNPPLRFRKLRIAWSVGCCVAALLITVWWVRSYSWYDTGYCPLRSPDMLIVTSWRGGLYVYAGRDVPYRTGWFPTGWGKESTSYIHIVPSTVRAPNWNYEADSYGVHILFPLWFAALFPWALAAAPWIGFFSYRFSLRTLLIATTVVAVTLGTIIWLTHR
jgi:hypothetical protein